MARYRLLIALALAMVAAPVAAQDLPASLAAIPPTVPTEGSLGPGVYLEDITYTIRLAFVRTLTVSRTNPDVAFAGSYDGFVWKTVDGGRTWDESRLIVETKPFWGDAYERVYFGVHRLDSGPSRAFDDKTARRSGRTGNREGAASGGGNENQSSVQYIRQHSQNEKAPYSPLPPQQPEETHYQPGNGYENRDAAPETQF